MTSIAPNFKFTDIICDSGSYNIGAHGVGKTYMLGKKHNRAGAGSSNSTIRIYKAGGYDKSAPTVVPDGTDTIDGGEIADIRGAGNITMLLYTDGKFYHNFLGTNITLIADNVRAIYGRDGPGFI